MTSKKQGRVFISHSSIDYPEALEICRKIEERGVRCAIAPRDIPLGANYASWIGETINNATAFIVVISHSSIKSKPVLSELEEAFNGNGLPIYPVRIDPIQRAGLPFDIRFFIGVRQMIDAIRPLRADALDRLSKSIAREVLGQGPAAVRDERAALTGEQTRFQALWARMDERRSPLAWLWEAALGGPLWLFHRGMDRLGALMVALLAVLVLAIGLAGGMESAALVLILGWLGLCLYLGVIGASLLRRHVGDRVERIVAQGGGAVGPAMLSLAALVGALGAGAFAWPGRPVQPTGPSEAGPVRKASEAVTGPPAFVPPNTTLARTQGNAADYREKAAQEEREQAAALAGAAVGAVVGYGAGLQDGQHDAAAIEAAEAEHTADEVNAQMGAQ